MKNKKLPWLRLYSDIVDNEKIRLLSFDDRWFFIALLCIKRQGILESTPALIERKIAIKLGVQRVELDEIKRRLVEVELIDENYSPVGWDEHQYNSDEDKTATERKRKQRLKEKENKVTKLSRVTVTNVTAIDTDTDTDTDTDKEKTNGRITFDQFYDAYPKKEKKQDALKAWKKIGDNLKQTILDDVEKRTALVWDDRKYIPAPSTYLNGKRWEDEIVAHKQPEQPQRTRKII